MNLFLEVEGKIFVGEGQPDPLVCPDCKRVFAVPGRITKENPLRCPYCERRGEKQEFEANFQQLGFARVLVQV